jgi:hypothetical protein
MGGTIKTLAAPIYGLSRFVLSKRRRPPAFNALVIGDTAERPEPPVWYDAFLTTARELAH